MSTLLDAACPDSRPSPPQKLSVPPLEPNCGSGDCWCIRNDCLGLYAPCLEGVGRRTGHHPGGRAWQRTEFEAAAVALLVRFRQRLLLDGAALADDVILDSPIHVQLVSLPFDDISVDQQPELAIAAAGGLIHNVTCCSDLGARTVPFATSRLPRSTARVASRGCFWRLVTRIWAIGTAGHLCGWRLKTATWYSYSDHYSWVASLHARVDVVQLLLHATVEGIDGIDEPDMYGRTPLWEAAQSGHTEVVRLLLQASADKDSGEIYSRTPVCEAARHGHVDVVRLLLQAGAERDQSDFGSTLLSVAHADVACLLSETSASKTLP